MYKRQFQVVGTDTLEDSMVIGELGLDGRVKPVSGVLSLAAMAREKGIKRCFLPIENVAEGLVMEGVDMVGVESLGHMAGIDVYKRQMQTGRKIHFMGMNGSIGMRSGLFCMMIRLIGRMRRMPML